MMNERKKEIEQGQGRIGSKFGSSMDRIKDFKQYPGKERLLSEPKTMNNKKFNGSYTANGNKLNIRNNYKRNPTTSSEQSLTPKLIRYSSFRQNSQENTYPKNTRCSSFRIEPKIICDETWLSNKQYNTRVTAHADTILKKKIETPAKLKSPRTSTYQVSNGQVVHERIYPGKTKKNLCLHVAVNGASKSMRGELPLSNLNLTNGDFGDDAGMIVEKRDYCFVGLADGAGGNRSLGINPADFSRAIVASCRTILRQTSIPPNQLPRLILSAMKKVEASHIRGSSTLCLLALDKQKHTLTSLNIGDSGFIIYRNNEILRRSKCTMNANGCGPRQVFAVNGALGLPCFINENEVLRDCSLDTVEVQKDDIIILSSDGLWDVIKADQLQEIMERNINSHLQDLADDLLSQAVEGYIANGRDDILVIVCRIDTD